MKKKSYSTEPPSYSLEKGKNDGLDNPGFVNDNGDMENGQIDKKDEEIDLWELPELKDTSKPFKEMNGNEKVVFVLWVILRIILFLGFLYLFVCSLDFLSSAFRLLGGHAAGEVFRNSDILRNPVTGLMIGVLATVLVQSSSTSTSIVVAMVGAELLEVATAIPIVMGANIGTSVTNTIVALGQITDKDDFRRAFAGATVHDMFNWVSVIILLPLEVISGYLFRLSGAIVDSLHLEKYKEGKKDLLKAITKPFTTKIVQVDSKAIQKIAKSEDVYSLLKLCCKSETPDPINKTLSNGTWYMEELSDVCVTPCEFIFKDTGLRDSEIGVILLIIALVLLCVCLFAIVKLLNSLLKGNIRKIIKKIINAEFPGKCGYFTGYLAILVGCGLTILVQSSSIFTSAMTPLVGVGVISIERMYPLTLGSNIGTTTTGILAALAQDADKIRNPLQLAFCHLFFNISGILILYPIPFMRVPITLAKFLGTETSKYRWFAIFYLFLMFFLLPLFVFGLSVAGWEVMTAVLIPIACIIIFIFIIKVIQRKKPSLLPKVLRNWKFLPLVFRSLEPIDRVMQLCFCSCCRSKAADEPPHQRTDMDTKI
ncbi:sodium-dependent phosphate transport protein 2B-like [Ylistrum balloti]|uniref:sodium-dependent phosphate transport protein 2B-like n=1 Tax=Ylistrum balloti TaxID=509963 RepID=UPI002905CE66|nr:sodium-dependent phosphate transport protein 2B-like [Ylistrum balloti]